MAEIILAVALSMHIGSGAMQAAAEGVSIAKRYRYDIHAEFVELFLLVDFAGFNNHVGMIEHETIHRQPNA